MRTLRVAAAAAVLLLPGLALAEMPAGAATPARAASPSDASDVEMPTLLLPVTLAGTTNGKGTLNFGIGVAYGVGDRYDVATSVTGSAATQDGLATLFSYRPSADKPDPIATWDVGLNLSFAVLNDKRKLDVNASLPPEVRRAMFDTCDRLCAPSSDNNFCKSRATKLEERLGEWLSKAADELSPDEFCVGQRKKVRDADATGDAAQRKSERETALKACVSGCAAGSADPFCASSTIATERGHLYLEYNGNNLCDEGKAMHRKYGDERGRSLYPAFLANAGFKVGWQQFQYREASGDAPDVLLEQTRTTRPWLVGVSLLGLPQVSRLNPTIEVQGLLGSTWDASTKTVRWCAPAGNVPEKDPEPGAPVGTTHPGETCREATLGAPTKKTTLTMTVRAGLVDGARSNWRIAFGPDVSLASTSDGLEVSEFALRIPIYGAVTPFKDVEYKGILRLTPAVTLTPHDGARSDIRALVEIALLGQRRLFSDRFDQL
ncbi:hypothetical protein [Sorangium sp. So ce542]|uniref:hypothetical protein n=1 Tax=Sorangium sp. So ce542 TaxID=3133316 RepID=UPI003F642F65